jgi:dihydroflavonol-4-reductase
MLDIARMLRRQFGEKASRVPTREIPSWLIRLTATVNPTLRMVVPFLGLVKEASHDKATRLLGWRPRDTDESVIATAESLFKLGLVK